MADHAEHLLYGIYRAICFDKADPQALGRIRMQIPLAFGSDPSGWAYGCFPVSSRTLPAIGQGVWAMFQAGDPDNPVWLGVF